jgi:hypothetical protein
MSPINGKPLGAGEAGGRAGAGSVGELHPGIAATPSAALEANKNSRRDQTMAIFPSRYGQRARRGA